MNIQQLSPQAYNYNAKSKNQNVSFGLHFPGFEEKVAIKTGKIIQKKSFEKIIKTINDHPKFADNLFAHLTVFGSTLLSIFYVGKTLTNKSLEEDKRKTLAINQGLVWAVSTVCAYTLDNATNDLQDGFIRRIQKLHPNKNTKVLESGLRCAKSMIAIDLVYRFIAPVLVTPIANHIGNKLKENKAAKLAQSNNHQKLNKVG